MANWVSEERKDAFTPQAVILHVRAAQLLGEGRKVLWEDLTPFLTKAVRK